MSLLAKRMLYPHTPSLALPSPSYFLCSLFLLRKMNGFCSHQIKNVILIVNLLWYLKPTSRWKYWTTSQLNYCIWLWNILQKKSPENMFEQRYLTCSKQKMLDLKWISCWEKVTLFSVNSTGTLWRLTL